MAKKATKKATKTIGPVPNPRKEVTVEKARNGYVISALDQNYNRQVMVARTKKEAQRIATRMLK